MYAWALIMIKPLINLIQGRLTPGLTVNMTCDGKWLEVRKKYFFLDSCSRQVYTWINLFTRNNFLAPKARCQASDGDRWNKLEAIKHSLFTEGGSLARWRGKREGEIGIEMARLQSFARTITRSDTRNDVTERVDWSQVFGNASFPIFNACHGAIDIYR